MSGKLFYQRVATTVPATLKAGGATIQTVVEVVQFTATTTGTVAISDGETSFTVDVIAGINHPLHLHNAFKPGADVTFTPTGPTLSVFAGYSQK